MSAKKMDDKPIKNTSELNENDRKTTGKFIKKIAVVAATAIAKPMLVVVIVFTIITFLADFVKIIFNIKEDDANGVISASVSMQYKEELRNY